MRLAALSLGLLSFVSALPQITRTGKYLYDPSGNRFYIKGVAYQPAGAVAVSSASNDANGGFPEPSSYIDPLSSPANCTRDIPYLKQLGVNAVRVYSVTSYLNHDSCMASLSSAGIYVMLDVSLPLNGSIDRSSPAWTTSLLDQYITTIDAFRNYDNILAFNVGNEVINLASNTNAAPFVKAAARDVKAYLKSVNSNALVGYSAVDGDATFRNTVAQYMTCGDNSVSVDIYGLNNYEWCGNETLQSSNWDTITSGFANLPVAAYMSEYGCITSPPRVWTEVPALYSAPVSNVFSGGVAFSYFPTSDGYGMVTFSSDGKTVMPNSDFTRLGAQYNATTPANTPTKSSAPAVSALSCPSQSANFLASNTLPPTPDELVCNCLNSNAFACGILPTAANQPILIGNLTGYACSLLATTNSTASCAAIAGNGTSGVYGPLSGCSPVIKLSYAASAYYFVNPVFTSCQFGGAGALAQYHPPTAEAASNAAKDCLAQLPSGGVFTPTPPSTSTGAAKTGSSSPGSSAAASGTRSAAERVTLIGGGGMTTIVLSFVGLIGGAWLVL